MKISRATRNTLFICLPECVPVFHTLFHFRGVYKVAFESRCWGRKSSGEKEWGRERKRKEGEGRDDGRKGRKWKEKGKWKSGEGNHKLVATLYTPVSFFRQYFFSCKLGQIRFCVMCTLSSAHTPHGRGGGAGRVCTIYTGVRWPGIS